jgi:hypothetical protein
VQLDTNVANRENIMIFLYTMERVRNHSISLSKGGRFYSVKCYGGYACCPYKGFGVDNPTVGQPHLIIFVSGYHGI